VTIRDLPLIARITREEFQRIHRYCAEHDVEGSRDPTHIYDAPTGGAINVWSGPWGVWGVTGGAVSAEDVRLRRESQLRGTYYPEREDYLHPGLVLESQMVALGAGRPVRGLDDPTGLSGGEEIPPSRMVNVHWEPGDTDAHVLWDGDELEARRAAAWTAAQARAHFEELYRTVFGQPLVDRPGRAP